MRCDLGKEVDDQTVELVGMLDHRPVAAAVEQHEAGVRDVREQVETDLEVEDPVVLTVNEQGWDN